MKICSTVAVNALEFEHDGDHNTTRHLARRKRYLTFPEGSTFSFAFCMELKTVTQDIDLYSEGVAVSANYDLPNKPDLLFTSRPRPMTPLLLRRRRRDLFTGLENLLNISGVDGRSCILLAVCETSQKLTPGVGMVEELIRVMFRIPVEELSREEPREHWQYSSAYKSGVHNLDCQQLYPRCPLSLLSVIMDLKPSNLFYK